MGGAYPYMDLNAKYEKRYYDVLLRLIQIRISPKPIRNPNWSTSGMRVTLSYLMAWEPGTCFSPKIIKIGDKTMFLPPPPIFWQKGRSLNI
jgi:hypothetical protein